MSRRVEAERALRSRSGLLVRVLSCAACLLGIPTAFALGQVQEYPTDADRSGLILRPLPDQPGLHRLFHVSPRVYSGAEPRGDDAFAALARRGVRTLVCVDSSHPRIEQAARHGLRYIHIPIGYDQISPEASAAMATVMRSRRGAVFVHCHHGRQRGPSMAAIAAIVEGAATPEQAVEVLSAIGTSRLYAGLWRDVLRFKMPDADLPVSELRETANLDELAEVMAELDRTWDRVKTLQQRGWRSASNHPGLDGTLAAKWLRRQLQHAANAPYGWSDDDSADDGKVANWFQAAVEDAKSLEDALARSDYKKAAGQVMRIQAACNRCHASIRNR